MNISAVVPVYNAEQSLVILCQELASSLSQLAEQFEIVLVNDGSQDSSWRVIEKLSSEHDYIRGMNLLTNYGQHNALLCGIRNAQYEVIVTLDDDLQNPPSEIHKLISKLNEGHDVVYGSPEAQQHGLARNLASQITKLVLQHAMGAEIATRIGPFRAFRTALRKGFAGYCSQSINIDVLLTWTTRRFASVPVRHDTRLSGTSGYSLSKLINHALNMATGFSTVPLQIASVNGFFFMLFGVGVLMYAVIRYLVFGTTVPGFPFLASVIAIFAGAQLFALGIIGEYLARIYIRTLGRPVYIIDSEAKNDSMSFSPPAQMSETYVQRSNLTVPLPSTHDASV